MRKSIETDESSLFAGVWFSAASCIPVIYTFIISRSPDFSITTILLYAIIPISIAFFFGGALGSDILNPNKVTTSTKAILEGIKIALFSFVVYVLAFGLFTAFYQTIFNPNSQDFLTVDFMKNLLLGLVLSGIVGSIMVGWLVIIAGAIAGWLLFKYRLISARTMRHITNH